MNNKIEKQMIEAIERLVARANNKKQMTIEEQEAHLKANRELRRARRRNNKLNK